VQGGIGNFSRKLVAMAMSLEESEKVDLIQENSRKDLPFGEKIVKIDYLKNHAA